MNKANFVAIVKLVSRMHRQPCECVQLVFLVLRTLVTAIRTMSVIIKKHMDVADSISNLLRTGDLSSRVHRIIVIASCHQNIRRTHRDHILKGLGGASVKSFYARDR